MPVPKPIIAIPGEHHSISRTIDNFFSETKKLYEKSHATIPHGFEIKSGIIYYSNHQSNDRITYLLYGSIILAQVLETRTEFNSLRYTFSRNIKK